MSESPSSDSVVRRCISGDFSAWPKFIERFSCLIFRTVKSKINRLRLNLPETDTYDICQRVLLSIWHKQKLKKIKDPERISNWLIRVAQNETVDYAKSKQPLLYTGTIDEIKPIPAYTPLNEAHKDELGREIEVFIDALPLKERRIAVLDIFYDLKYAQISRIVNLPLGTIASVIKRVKADLKRHLFMKGHRF